MVGVVDRVKTLAAQDSDGSISGVMEDDILTATLETLEHRGQVRGVSSSLGWSKGFCEEFAGMYRKKRNKRSNAHDMMDITFKSIAHALRLSGIKIPKMYLFLPNYERLLVAARKKMCMAARKKMCMTAWKNMCMTARKMEERKIIGMPAATERIKFTVKVDLLC
jgi:hypothetical protein